MYIHIHLDVYAAACIHTCIRVQRTNHCNNSIRYFNCNDSRSWVICGAAVSCLGQQLSEMAEAAFQLQGGAAARVDLSLLGCFVGWLVGPVGCGCLVESYWFPFGGWLGL